MQFRVHGAPGLGGDCLAYVLLVLVYSQLLLVLAQQRQFLARLLVLAAQRRFLVEWLLLAVQHGPRDGAGVVVDNEVRVEAKAAEGYRLL